MYPEITQYIDGEFVQGEGRRETDVLNPATNLPIGKLPHATNADLDRALSSAQRAFESWRNSSPMLRSQILRKVGELARERAQTIGRNITLDQGKPLAEAVEPIGVCVAFSPWNFPFNQAIRKVAAAIGAGCSVIVKGSSDTPSAVVAIAHLFHDAGLPPGVLNVVWGDSGMISDRLIRSPIVRKISFTGSTPVGQQLAALAGSLMKRCTMELGGHAPVIVCDDADIDTAVDQLVGYKFRNAGQVCVSPTRFFVQEGAYDHFVDRFVAKTQAIKVGDGLEAGSRMGPLAQRRRIAAMEGFVDDARQRGANIRTGGHALPGEGNFYAPTVITDLPEDARFLNEEPFGPMAGIVRFGNLEDALQRANRLPFGLASYAFTRSAKNAHAISRGLEAGMVSINHIGLALAETPFGGIKESGYGSEGGSETFDGYLTTKFITQLN